MASSKGKRRRGTPRPPAAPQPAPRRAGLVETWGVAKVPDGVEYTGVLRTGANAFLPVLGVAVGVVSFFAFAGVVTQGLIGLFWMASGSPGGFTDFYRSLVSYEHPFGMVAVHLGLAMLIPISIALVLVLHHVRPGYLASVTGGMRWRPFWVFLAVAFVALNAVLLVQTLASGGGFTVTPQQGFVWFLLAVLITSPIQAAAEELFFRGYLMQALGSLVPNHWFGILGSATVFALFHGTQNVWLFLDRLAFGVLAGLLVVKTGGLEAAIAAHVVNNVCAFTYAGLGPGIAQLKALQEVGPWEALGDVVMWGVFTAAALVVGRRLGLATRTGQPGLGAGASVQ